MGESRSSAVTPAPESTTIWPPVIAIVGPTAVGKSALALALAQALDAVIVAADSRQVYRYLNIGTAKPTAQDRAAVPHFMIDLVEPCEPYSAQRYADEARRVLRLLAFGGRPALLVGGTGFYIEAALIGVPFPSVSPNPELRRRLVADVRKDGAVALHARLAAVDQASAARIHPHNISRVIRALEIVQALGGPVPRPGPADEIPALIIGLSMERDRLRRIADARVVAQVSNGLVEETQSVLKAGYLPSSPGLDGFGYRQMVAYLQGRLTLSEAIEEYSAATHAYIRRQMTWFRRDSRVIWLEADGQAVEIALRLAQEWLASASVPTSRRGPSSAAER
jgi:tRNA dimethylallyltransferase